MRKEAETPLHLARLRSARILVNAKKTSTQMLGASFAFAILVVLCFSPTLAAQTKTTHQLSGYHVLAIEPFTVDKNPATENFPAGLEKVMRSTALRKVREKKLFESVIDGADLAAKPPEVPADITASSEPVAEGAPAAGEAPATPEAPAAEKRTVILSGTVIQFDKGSQAARFWVGMGAGASKVRVRFVMRDAATGAEVMRFDLEGKFYGMWSAFAGSDDEAMIKAATSVVKNLVKTLEQNR